MDSFSKGQESFVDTNAFNVSLKNDVYRKTVMNSNLIKGCMIS